MKKAVISILLLICVVFGFAALPARADDADGSVTINVPFASVGGAVLDWDFPYSDSNFLVPSEDFSEDMVRASLGLMVSAFYNKEGIVAPQFETYLGGAGFQDIYTFGYGEETSKDTLAGIMGWKRIGDFILIAAAPRGWGYEKEWAGNLEVGAEERHVGFNNGAQIMESQLLAYINEHNLTGKMKLWITGFSRAAAVSNLTAADMIDSGMFDDVYAYLFGVPRTTKAADHADYTGIFNICGKNDPVPQVPMESWGYYRYGQDLYTPSQETDSGFPNMSILAQYISSELRGDQFIYSPEVSYHIHLILEFLNEMFPTNEDYVNNFQDTLMSIWTEADPDNILNILMKASSNIDSLDISDKKRSQVFSDYLSLIISQLTAENSSLVNDAHWNPRQGLGENLLREHMPYTYITWAFSGVPEEELYHGNSLTRRLSLFGDIDVEVWKGDLFVDGRDSEGNHIYNENNEGRNYFDLISDPEQYAGYMQKVFIARNGSETVINLPADNNFDIRIRPHGLTTLIYYDVICSADKTFGEVGSMYSQTLSEGEYHLAVRGTDPLPYLMATSGTITAPVKTAVAYSPTFIMANECSTGTYAKMDDIIRFVVVALMIVVVILLACLVICIIHAVRKRKGKGPYSSWYVIIPHLMLIVLFILMNMYVTYYLFSIGIARTICVILIQLCIFLLSLRGLIRNRVSWNIVIAAGILCMAAIDLLLYQPSPLVTSSLASLIIYAVCMAIFAVIAAASFFIKKKHPKEEKS